MNLKQHLTEKKSVILASWHDALLTLPEGGTPDFLENQKKLVSDATGSDVAQGLDGLFSALLQGVITDDAKRFLDCMIGIRAAHNIRASQTVAVILAVKNVVRNELGQSLKEPGVAEELTAWDSVVDEMALFAFDRYMESRESVLERRADEEKQETLRLLKKAKLIPDDQD